MRILLYGNTEDMDRDILVRITSSELCRVKDNATFQKKLNNEQYDYLIFNSNLFSGLKDYLIASMKIAQGNCSVHVNRVNDSMGFETNSNSVLLEFSLPFKK